MANPRASRLVAITFKVKYSLTYFNKRNFDIKQGEENYSGKLMAISLRARGFTDPTIEIFNVFKIVLRILVC